METKNTKNVKLYYDGESRTLLAEIIGDIDHCSAKNIRQSIDQAILKHIPLRLILDFDSVSFMDSSGIGLIIGRYKLMNDLEGNIIVTNPKANVNKVMQLAGIDRLCKIIMMRREDKISGGMKI